MNALASPSSASSPARGTPRRLLLRVFQGVFFLSGFAALLYQMIWQRLLTFFGGADVYSVTLIVSAFMGGLGLGSLAGGHLADHLNRKRRILAFAGAEMAIAAFALVSVPLVYDLLYVRLGALALPRAVMACVLFVTLLWPTFFMGMSLPLLAKAVSEDAVDPAARVASLYGWNTLGAAVGALVTVWVLARQIGFAASVEIGAAMNLVCAASAVLAFVMRRRSFDQTEAATLPKVTAPAPTSFFTLRTWILLYGLSGFVALSLEILWFRMLGTILKSNSFTFATLLALYLSGVGLGALVGRRFARRSARPGAVFLALQAAIPVYSGLSLAGLLHAVERWSVLAPLRAYMGGYETLTLDAAVRAFQRAVTSFGDVSLEARHAAGLFFDLYLLVPIVLIGLPTLLMGMSFPFLQQAAQTDVAALGRRVGWLQAANIAGCTLGSALTGLVLLQLLGSAWTLRLLVLSASVFLWLLLRRRPARAWAALALVLLAAGLCPSSRGLWARMHGARAEQVIVAEDGSGLSLMKLEESGETIVFVNGLGQSTLPYGQFHTLLGALPALLHPAPESVAVIGLGSGDTVFAVGGREETRSIDCIEIVTPQLETLKRLDERRYYPALRALLGDTRVRHTFTDGRAFVARGGLYDIIEADALRPNSAYAGNLYSLEYFELLRRHLKPGGFGVTWQPTARTRQTFVAAFPHVMAFDAVLIGSNEPIAYERALVESRLQAAFTRAYYERAQVGIAALLQPYLDRGPVSFTAAADRGPVTDLNTDLFPRDEYMHSARFLAAGPWSSLLGRRGRR